MEERKKNIVIKGQLRVSNCELPVFKKKPFSNTI